MLLNNNTDGVDLGVFEYKLECMEDDPVDPLGFSYQPRSYDVSALQGFYDEVMYMYNSSEYIFENEIMDNMDLSLPPVSMTYVTSGVKFYEKKYNTIKPAMKTHCPTKRDPTFTEMLLAMLKRNLGVHHISEKMNDDHIVKLMVKRFIAAFVSKDCVDIFNSYYENKICLNKSLINSWLPSQDPKIDTLVDPDTVIQKDDMNRYSLMIKRLPKPKLEVSAINEYSSLQTIAAHSKTINVLFCPIFREFKRLLLSVLPDNFKIFTDCSPLEFEENLSKFMPAEELDTDDKLEIDISKYDKSQGELLLKFELEIYRLFGIDEEALELWKYAHEHTVLYDKTNKMKFNIDYQRKSGNASTYIGNTIVLMGVISTLFNMLLIKYGFFSGDDSLLIGGVKGINRNDECAKLFNLESKFLRYRYSYFCSKFLLNAGGKLLFIPDPFKLIVKLGRTDLVNEDHVEQYRVSLCDLMSQYGISLYNIYLNDAINERYNTTGDHSIVYSTIHGLINDKEEFAKLYYFEEGDIVRDPSLPGLE